jgi:hypothetical protein
MMPWCYPHDVRTTLTLDDDVAAGLAAAQRRLGVSLKRTVNELLRDALTRQRPRRSAAKLTVPARPLGLRPGLSYDSISALLDAADRREPR